MNVDPDYVGLFSLNQKNEKLSQVFYWSSIDAIKVI